MAPHRSQWKAMNLGLFPPAGGGGAGAAIAPRGDKVVTDAAAAVDAPAAPQSASELPTLSTPPTVRTTVEADEESRILNLDPRRAREEKQGGSGGGEGEPNAAGALDAGWARALSARSYCKLGRCAYANLDRRGPDRYLAAIGCDGYQASQSTDPDGRVTVRWGLCPRHREWWRLERIRRAGERATKS